MNHPRPRFGKTKSDKAPVSERKGIRQAAKKAAKKEEK